MTGTREALERAAILDYVARWHDDQASHWFNKGSMARAEEHRDSAHHFRDLSDELKAECERAALASEPDMNGLDDPERYKEDAEIACRQEAPVEGPGREPVGWKLVPIEPTPEQGSAAQNALNVYVMSLPKSQREAARNSFTRGLKDRLRYMAMVRAAPQPPTAPTPSETQGLREATDAMVNAALEAWFAEINDSETDQALARSMRQAINAALTTTPSPAPGLVEAAEWHESKADDYAAQRAVAWKDKTKPAPLILGTLSILEEEHRAAATHFRARATGGVK